MYRQSGLLIQFEAGTEAAGDIRADKKSWSSKRTFMPFSKARSRASFAFSPVMSWVLGSIPWATICREKRIPDGMDIPQELSRRQDRLQAIAEAKTKIEERAARRR